MERAKQYIQANRAALFDWIVLTASFLLGFIFSSLRELVMSPVFYEWMLLALLLYVVGAALKHLPLSYRLSNSGKSIQPVPFLVFLLIGHWLVMFVLVLVAGPAIRHLLHLPTLAAKSGSDGKMIVLYMVLAAFITWLVYRDKTKRKKRKEFAPNFLFRLELVADIFLVFSVTVFSFVFWEKGVMGLLSRASTRTLTDVFGLFVLLCVMFVLCYLPFRYLFFIEDRDRGRNGRRLLLLFGFILARAALEFAGI
ncbi:MAG: hypothetical protein ABIT05_04840 [Chitinophagaceae bacterium]